MPTYVYRREDGTTFEVFQRISDDPLEVDPDTGKPVRRMIGGGAGLIFKGTGFYETDYVRKSGGGKPEAKTESKSDASPSESSTASSESNGTAKASNGESGSTAKATKKTVSGDD
jgi:predicted nucleic acid-binding Zn ribbon protein